MTRLEKAFRRAFALRENTLPIKKWTHHQKEEPVFHLAKRGKMSTTQTLNTYHVKVGLAECTVSCDSEQEAVKLAKGELCQQMPHMGTIIEGIRDKEFRVDQVE